MTSEGLAEMFEGALKTCAPKIFPEMFSLYDIGYSAPVTKIVVGEKILRKKIS